MAATISPDQILRELTHLWTDLGKEGQSEGGAGVLRACTLTLIVVSEESDDPSALGETIAALMPEHPARTILIRLRGAKEHTLAERVYAQCWMPFGQRRQICCEQIEITASDDALGDLDSVLLPLAATDLPVVVWCRSARLAAMPEFAGILGMARKVVLDSAGFADPRSAVRRMADTVQRGVMLGDLAWTRLTRWRESLCQVFENPQYLERLSSVSRVHIRSGGDSVPLMAAYMGAWIRNALADAGVSAEVSWDTDRSLAERVLLEVELSGPGFRVRLAREGETLVVAVDELSTCTSLSTPTDYLLMREELGISGRDRVFERTLASAADLAYPTDK
jgi:glucose-6-phosphate dehydrogenase assembly protein OpcA